MERLYYEEPSLERKEEALSYIQEFKDNNSPINGVGGLHRFTDDYEGWLLKLQKEKDIEPTELLVPAETYFLIRESDNKLIGMTNIRLTLNKRLRQYGGHIGYGIRPSERRKGYNKINLYLALKVCEEHGIDQAMLTCDKDNLASSRTMKALGAVKEREIVTEDGVLEEIYWIDVKKSLAEYQDTYETQTMKKR